MKKTLIILILVLGLIWLLLMPAVVGWYVARAVPDWLAEIAAGEQAQFEPGWFSSTLDYSRQDADHYDLNLHTQHFPPLGLDWVQIDGQLQTPWSAAAFDIKGELSLRGATSLIINAPSLEIAGNVAATSGPVALRLNQAQNQDSTIDLELATLTLTDALGNILLASQAALSTGWRGLEDENLALVLDLAVDATADFGLSLNAQPVQRDALSDLIQGLQQLASSEDNSTAQQFAMLTVAGAWQQLSQNGLQITLEGLQLGTNSQFSGGWNTAQGQPMITGQGSLASLQTSLQPLVGLSTRQSPDDAMTLIQAWLEQLSTRGWLIIEGDRFEFHYPGLDDVS